MIVPVGMVADVWAESPADQLRRQIDRVVHVLADPDLKAAGRERERQAAVSKIAEEIFDHMLRRGDRWMAYDVAIEGVSLVANYRTQFNRIIQSSSYRALVDKLKSKGG